MEQNQASIPTLDALMSAQKRSFSPVMDASSYTNQYHTATRSADR
jgi:hypothetical protein